MAIKFDELLEALDPSLDKFEEDLDSMWIIIPTEKRYDNLTADDYFKFAKKYGTFNNQKDCFDKIEELAPDRWDAFIPMRIEGVNESLNESMTKEELNAKAYIIRYLNRNEYSKIASLLNDFDFKLTEDPDTTGYVDLNTKHVVLNRNLSMDDAIKSILNPLKRKYFRQALKDPDFIQQMKDENKEIEKLLHEKEKNESLNEAFNINDSFKFNSDKKTIDFISKLENYFIKKGINAYSAYDMASNLWKINIDKKEFVLTISDPVFHLYTTNNNRPLHNWSNMYYDDLLKDCIYAIESNL